MEVMEQTRNPNVLVDLAYLTYDKAANIGIAVELVNAGYRIKFTSSLGETLLCLRQAEYAVLIIGPLVSAADKRLLVADIRRRGGVTKVVCLYRDSVQGSIDADAMIDIHSGTPAIVEILRKLVQPIQ